MKLTEHNFLTEELISVRLPKGKNVRLSLPGVLATLCENEIESFTKIQPHQTHAWHAFLVQLSAIALNDASYKRVEKLNEDKWRELLRKQTSGFDNDEPWSLYVEDLSKPAFFQPPIPKRCETQYKSSPLFSPDLVSILNTAKNHDLKTERTIFQLQEHWLYALVTLQTMQGFLGSGNYGITRMNGGFGNRPCFSFIPGTLIGERYRREVNILLKERINIIERMGYKKDEGIKLLWIKEWDGEVTLSFSELDPYFIEICRRVRIFQDKGKLGIITTTSKKARIEGGEAKGNTGDPWTPVSKSKGTALTLSSSGFTYKLLSELLFGADYMGGITQTIENDFHDNLEAFAQAMVRGQGKTEGFHFRSLPIPSKTIIFLREPSKKEMIAKLSKTRITSVETMMQKVLKPALLSLFQGGPEKLNFKDDRAYPYMDDFNRRIDSIFFDCLWRDCEISYEESQTRWDKEITLIAKSIFHHALESANTPSSRTYRGISTAEKTFYGLLNKHFSIKEVNNESSIGRNTENA